MKLKTELRSDVLVRPLFMREDDVETDAFEAHVMSPTIGSLHNSWTAPCDNDETRIANILADL
jgi:hypothetical protein